MGKFISLVKNEYIKLTLKKSTWIMLILLVIGTVGYPFVAKFAQWQGGDHSIYDYEEYSIQDYKDQIAYLKDVKTENWENETEALQYKIDNNILKGWQLEAVDAMFAVKYNTDGFYSFSSQQTDEYVRKIDDDIKSGNWKGYFETACEIIGQMNTEDVHAQGQKEIYEYCIENDIRPDETNWKYKTVVELKNAESEMKNLDTAKAAGQNVDNTEYENYENTKLKCEYRLKNNVDFDISEHNNWMETGEYNFWSVFCTTTLMISFIGLIVIVIGGGIVSSEFSGGTIKFLLINPVKRWKILVSKYFTTITFGFLLMLAAYILSAITILTVFGADNLSASYISAADGAVKEIPGFVYVLKNYLLSSIEIVVMATLAFAISSVARSSALAIGISVMAYFGGNTIMLILSQLNLSWGRYLIFANMDFGGIAAGESMFMGQTVAGALCVIAVHMIIFMLTAWDGFTRREA
ncbi:ABC transporter permease [Porcipelethomonas sp.]|uniref:ABC transporter permease n=1 Tax=Porcipelethomonas sp. TaxID=2981675 RepID=UPI003EF68199